MKDQAMSTTQVLVPLNQSNTLHNHIHVSVRLKPFSENEQQKKGQWQITNNETTIHHLHAKESFNFDRIFDPAVTTSEIFDSDLKGMIYNALKGYNMTVLAYG